VKILLAVVQANLQQSLPFGELDEDFRSVDTIRGVEVTPELRNGVRHKFTPPKRQTYIDLASAQQFIPADGLTAVYPELDLGLARVDHERALFFPKNFQNGSVQKCVKNALPATLSTRRPGAVRCLVFLVSRLQDHIRFERFSVWVVILRLDDCDSHDSGLGGMFTGTRGTVARSGEHTLTHAVSSDGLGSLAI